MFRNRKKACTSTMSAGTLRMGILGVGLSRPGNTHITPCLMGLHGIKSAAQIRALRKEQATKDVLDDERQSKISEWHRRLPQGRSSYSPRVEIIMTNTVPPRYSWHIILLYFPARKSLSFPIFLIIIRIDCVRFIMQLGPI